MDDCKKYNDMMEKNYFRPNKAEQLNIGSGCDYCVVVKCCHDRNNHICLDPLNNEKKYDNEKFLNCHKYYIQPNEFFNVDNWKEWKE